MAVVLLAALLAIAPQQRVVPTGHSTLQGQVVDASTQTPLRGARVWIVDLGLTAFTNAEGRFTFERLPGGSFTLTVSNVGYIFVKRKVDLPERSTLGLLIPLAEGQGTYTEDVTVSAEIERQMETGVGSQTTIGSGGLQSLRSVAADDPMRAVQALPGVAAGDDFRSEFSVRGASFRQMGIVIDGVATPMLVHTVKGRDDTGSVAMINTDILDSATLLAGAQPQRDGQWLGGVLKFTVREGSRDRTQVRVAASDTGAAGVIEGPLGKGKRGSWLYSIRKSYADWLIRKLDATFGSTLGFYDMQTKWAWDLTNRQQIQFLAIGGDANYLQQNTGIANGLHTANARSLVGSFTWRYLRPTFQASTRVSSAYSDFRNYGLLGQDQGDGHTSSLIWRTDLQWVASPHLTVEAGAQRQVDHDQRILREYSAVGTTSVRLRSEDRFGGDRRLASAWLNATARRGALAVVAGGRVVGDDPSAPPLAAPWMLAEYRLGSRAKLTAGVDRKIQYPDLFQALQAAVPLVPERALSFDLGLEGMLTKTIGVRAAVYRRNESNIIRSYNHEPRVVNNKLIPEAPPVWRNTLSGASRGGEFLVQRKAPTGLVGWIAYSYGRTRYDDRLTAESFDSDFDQRHTLNIMLEAKRSYRTSFAAKLRIGSGTPLPGYFKGDATDASGLFGSDVRNRVRLPHFLRLDLRANRTFTFDRRRLTLFAEVLNATARRNLGPAEGSMRSTSPFLALNYTERLLPWLPSIGILIEF